MSGDSMNLVILQKLAPKLQGNQAENTGISLLSLYIKTSTFYQTKMSCMIFPRYLGLKHEPAVLETQFQTQVLGRSAGKETTAFEFATYLFWQLGLDFLLQPPQ